MIAANGGGSENSIEDAPYIDNRVYISNIPFSFTANDLETIFEKYGTVLSAEVVENERGSKGFGFVTLTTADACDKARVALNGTLMGGRRIEVKKARMMIHTNAHTGTRNRPAASDARIGSGPPSGPAHPFLGSLPVNQIAAIQQHQRMQQILGLGGMSPTSLAVLASMPQAQILAYQMAAHQTQMQILQILAQQYEGTSSLPPISSNVMNSLNPSLFSMPTTATPINFLPPSHAMEITSPRSSLLPNYGSLSAAASLLGSAAVSNALSTAPSSAPSSASSQTSGRVCSGGPPTAASSLDALVAAAQLDPYAALFAGSHFANGAGGSAHMLLAQGTSPYFKAAPAAHKLSNLTMAQLPFSAPAAGLLAVRKRVSSTTSEDRQKKQCRSFML